jgi:hypothetical protein
MTILGKILVIVNLVFSLVTGALIVTVFATRTNWKDAYDVLKKRFDVAEANARTYQSEIDTIRASAGTEVKVARNQSAAAEASEKQASSHADDLLTQSKQLQDRLRLVSANIESATEELHRRKAEIDKLKEITADKEKKMSDLEELNKEYRDKMIEAQLHAEQEHERNVDLLNENVRLNKELEKRATLASSVSGAGGSSLRPPQDDVQGQVLDTDRTGLVTISIGSDQGLSRGNTLVVYRTQPKPEYVGVITILDTRFKESVARPVQPLHAGPIQKGDIVASRVIASR